jgi:hypothetical protein
MIYEETFSPELEVKMNGQGQGISVDTVLDCQLELYRNQ